MYKQQGHHVSIDFQPVFDIFAGQMDLTTYRHIQTPRLILINSTPDILEKILEGDEVLSSFLGIRIPGQWSEFGEAPFLYVKQQLDHDPLSAAWWSWLPVLKEENMLVGSCGYKGSPGDGIVEIGYEVARDYRGRGFATEIAKALIENARRDERVHTVIAHTLPEENESVSVLKKCGFRFDGTVEDPQDGTVWRWKLE